jgi:hypothetical protein
MEQGFVKQQVLGYLGVVLEPVVRLILRTGITWREFADLAKVKFVDVATADFGIRGRPTNASRVAILTGLDRRDVRKLRKGTPEPVTKGYHSKASQILAAWHGDVEFLNAAGQPAPLAIDGNGATFTELMRRYAPALPVVAMIKELKSADAIEELDDGRLRALTRAYVPRGVSGERLRLWSSVLSDIANTIEHNLSRDASMPSRFERRALNLKVDRKALPEFRRLVEAEGQAFLERIDDWLSAHQVDAHAADDGIRLGVGLYHIEDRVIRRPKTPKTKNESGDPR